MVGEGLCPGQAQKTLQQVRKACTSRGIWEDLGPPCFAFNNPNQEGFQKAQVTWEHMAQPHPGAFANPALHSHYQTNPTI